MSTSFGKLEELPSPQCGNYEADLGKRTRSGKEYEDPQITSGKRNKKDQPVLMDMDDEIIRIANTPLEDLENSSESPQPANKSRFRSQQKEKISQRRSQQGKHT